MECDQRVRIDHIDHIPLIDHIVIGRECMAGLGKAQSGYIIDLPFAFFFACPFEKCSALLFSKFVKRLPIFLKIVADGEGVVFERIVEG